jgi:hypothetical protein
MDSTKEFVQMKMIIVALMVVALSVRAEDTAAAGATVHDEVLKLKNQIVDIQNKGTFGLTNFFFCSEITGFGIYEPLKNPTLGSSGQLLIYLEPINPFLERKNGQYEFWMSVDMALLDTGGRVIQEMKDMQPMHCTSKSPIMDIFVQVSLNLEGAPSGTYTVRITLHDNLRKASVVREESFSVKK